MSYKMKEFLSLAEQNRQFFMGYDLAFHKQTKKNWKNIFALWISAAQQGHKIAQFYVGNCYDDGSE